MAAGELFQRRGRAAAVRFLATSISVSAERSDQCDCSGLDRWLSARDVFLSESEVTHEKTPDPTIRDRDWPLV